MKLVLPLVVLLSVSVGAQTGLTRVNRERMQQMLTSIKNELRKNYYDPTFRGRDIEPHFKAAAEALEQATSPGHALTIIGQALLDLDDSHTFFIPPSAAARVEYGWEMQSIGDACYIVAVRPGSDAEQKGLRRGDQVLALEGRQPSRETLWKIDYELHTLNPRANVRLNLRTPGQDPKAVEVRTKVTPRQRTLDLTGDSSAELDQWILEVERSDYLNRSRQVRVGKTVIWKLPTFGVEPEEMDRLAGETLKGTESLVLDLRGNPGGYVKTLERFTAWFFDRPLKIADVKGRKSMKVIAAKKRDRPFAGKVIVLVDSGSASAAELFARLMQIESRGTVIGDRSSGSVMQSYGYVGSMGADRFFMFGASITNADVIMTDGRSLEKAGVVPDELILPTAEDLAAGRDPVLARAAAILGIELDPKTAGAMFPVEWR